MKKLLLALPLLYYYGTQIPVRQYDKVEITCGKYAGIHGEANYFWKDGSMDVTVESLVPWRLVRHYYVTEYQCIQKDYR